VHTRPDALGSRRGAVSSAETAPVASSLYAAAQPAYCSTEGGDAMAVKPIPEGYHALTPGCAIPDCEKAIDFYKKVFGAEERLRMQSPGGPVMHAELKIGDSIVMLGDPMPPGAERSTMNLMLYTADCDAVFKRVVDAGAKVLQPMKDQFWGDRAGQVIDPFGNKWFIATHKEDVPPDEMAKRMKAAMGGG
jgi:PhnB protein